MDRRSAARRALLEGTLAACSWRLRIAVLGFLDAALPGHHGLADRAQAEYDAWLDRESARCPVCCALYCPDDPCSLR